MVIYTPGLRLPRCHPGAILAGLGRSKMCFSLEASPPSLAVGRFGTPGGIRGVILELPRDHFVQSWRYFGARGGSFWVIFELPGGHLGFWRESKPVLEPIFGKVFHGFAIPKNKSADPGGPACGDMGELVHCTV